MSSTSNHTRLNAMTVDVEDYFQVSAFESTVSTDKWDEMPLRVGHNTHRLLDLFAEKGVKSTFFTLGWVAKRCPDVIKRIVDEGHELASHGLSHRRATTMNRAQVTEDIRVSKDILEQTGGTAIGVTGHRVFLLMEAMNGFMRSLVSLALSIHQALTL